MTIDEAIAHAREVAEFNRKKVETDCVTGRTYLYPFCECIKCAEEHEQLAKWLEELNAYRKHVFSGEMTQAMLKEERNKAIDDFSEAVKVAVTEMDDIKAYDNPTQRICKILQIEAERLKAGKDGDEP